MKQHLLIVGTAALLAGLVASVPSAARSDETIRPASFLDVKFADSLWAARQETNRRTTIPYVLDELKRRGSVSRFAVLAGRTEEKYRGYMWADSDVYKTLEGIAYSLRTSPDASLEKEAEEIIGWIVRAQAADGYLMPHLQIAEPDHTHYSQETIRTCESYSQGHLIESAVADFEATGRREYLDAAIKTADLLARVYAEGRLELMKASPPTTICPMREPIAKPAPRWRQQTQYPWDGAVKLTVNPSEPQEFTVAVRIPAWCREEATPGGLYRASGPTARPTLKVNGAAFDAGPLDSGFARIRPQWKPGDVVELELPMPVRRMYADSRVRADAGRVALQRASEAVS